MNPRRLLAALVFTHWPSPALRSARRPREADARQRDGAEPRRVLHKVQQLMHERVMFAPILEPAFLNGYGARVAESCLGLITGHLHSAPYEDLKLKDE